MNRKELSTEEARKLLEAADQERVRRCQQEIEALLQRHGCQIVSQIFVTQDGRLATRLVITAVQGG